MSRTLYRVTLAPMPSNLPPIARLKAALKRLKRAYALRATRVEELEPRASRSRPGAAP